MSKIKHIKLLENLSNQKKINKNFNRTFRLEKQGFSENTQELFKPIIDQQEKTNENILKAIEQNPNKVPAIEENPVILPPIEKVKSDHSLFVQHLKDNNNLLLRLSQRNTAQIQIDNNNTGFLKILPKDGNPSTIKNTQGLSELLFNKNIDLENPIFTKEDRETYETIYRILGEKYPTSKRGKDIKKVVFPNVPAIGNGIVTISENPEELFKRLEILLAAKSQGHNNSKEEISAILDELLKQKQINKEQYLSIYH